MEFTQFESLYPANSRFDEIEKILSFVKEGNSSQVVGLPGTGRSNLLGLLAYNRDLRIKHLGENQKNFHFVLINFSEVRNKPLLDAQKLIFLRLVDSLKERNMTTEYEKIAGIFKESLSFNDELILFQGLKSAIDFLAIEKALTIVLLIERFETYIPMVTQDFFDNLRILRSRAKYKFSVVLALNRPLEDVLEPEILTDFYEFLAGHVVYLPLADEPSIAFRIAYLEKVTDKTIDKIDMKKVITLTAGHGKLTRVCLENLLESPDTSPDAAFFFSRKTVQGALLEIWQALSPLEHTCLVSQKPCEHETPLYLDDVGLCKKGNITIPLFATFVREKAKDTKPMSSPILYHPETNTITKGDIVLSENLTVSEFRLLRFLLQNSHKVAEKEEIINAVWKEGKSTAGVTDQALDQLIFRLRKKIEDDPNNPSHIQTIKGRGIKFTS